MSEYQYHAFHSLQTPLSRNTREIMKSLSSRAKVTSHSATYSYHYSDFGYEPLPLLKQYFDLYFYIANFGCFRLTMKFKLDEVDLNSLRELKQKLAINVKRVRELVIIDINIGTEENIFVHADDEAEDIAQDLLPVFDEIRRGDYSFIWLAKALGSAHMGDDITALDALKKSRLPKHYTHVIELFECGDIIY